MIPPEAALLRRPIVVMAPRHLANASKDDPLRTTSSGTDGCPVSNKATGQECRTRLTKLQMDSDRTTKEASHNLVVVVVEELFNSLSCYMSRSAFFGLKRIWFCLALSKDKGYIARHDSPISPYIKQAPCHRKVPPLSFTFTPIFHRMISPCMSHLQERLARDRVYVSVRHR